MNSHNDDPRDERDDDEDGFDPFGQFFQAFSADDMPEEVKRQLEAMGFNPADASGVFNQFSGKPPSFFQSIIDSFQAFVKSPNGSVNWDMALDVALNHRELSALTQKMRGEGDEQQFIADPNNPLTELLEDFASDHEEHPDRPVTAQEASVVRQALSVADLWLDTVCNLAPSSPIYDAWNRETWIRQTLPAWKEICEPVAKNATRAISDALGEQLDRMGMADAQASASIPELGQLFGPMDPQQLLEKMSGGIFAMQIGQALGVLSQDTFGSTDIGLPLGKSSTMALLPANIADFARGLDIPLDEITQFLAVREAAYARLYARVPWLKTHITRAIADYAAEISIDSDAIDDAMRTMEDSLRESGPAVMEQGLAIDIFSTTHSPEQESTLLQLQTTLAVIEGWVEEVTTAATVPHLPHAMQLREMLRRRRFSGTPAEQLLKTLVGLEMRPKRVHDAVTLWKSVREEKGIEERDKLWSHPDVMPTPSELEDPENFLANRRKQREADADVDRELQTLLEGTLGWAEGLHPGDDSTGDQMTSGGEDDTPDDDQP